MQIYPMIDAVHLYAAPRPRGIARIIASLRAWRADRQRRARINTFLTECGAAALIARKG